MNSKPNYARSLIEKQGFFDGLFTSYSEIITNMGEDVLKAIMEKWKFFKESALLSQTIGNLLIRCTRYTESELFTLQSMEITKDLRNGIYRNEIERNIINEEDISIQQIEKNNIWNLAMVKKNQGFAQEAYQYFKKLDELHPNDPEILKELYEISLISGYSKELAEISKKHDMCKPYLTLMKNIIEKNELPELESIQNLSFIDKSWILQGAFLHSALFCEKHENQLNVYKRELSKIYSHKEFKTLTSDSKHKIFLLLNLEDPNKVDSYISQNITSKKSAAEILLNFFLIYVNKNDKIELATKYMDLAIKYSDGNLKYLLYKALFNSLLEKKIQQSDAQEKKI